MDQSKLAQKNLPQIKKGKETDPKSARTDGSKSKESDKNLDTKEKRRDATDLKRQKELKHLKQSIEDQCIKTSESNIMRQRKLNARIREQVI